MESTAERESPRAAQIPQPDDFATATAVAPPATDARVSPADVEYRQYTDEHDLGYVMTLVDNELSEPYSIFTYRYFLHSWPSLCFLAFHKGHCFGTVVCKLEPHGDNMRGYIAMLVVEQAYRGLGVGSQLVKLAIETMAQQAADEVTLEAEVTNQGALSLYTNLGFIRDKRLARYYMNGVDAFRLKLLLPLSPEQEEALAAAQLSNMSMQQPHVHSHACQHHHHHGCGHDHGHHHHHHPQQHLHQHSHDCGHHHHVHDHNCGHSHHQHEPAVGAKATRSNKRKSARSSQGNEHQHVHHAGCSHDHHH